MEKYVMEMPRREAFKLWRELEQQEKRGMLFGDLAYKELYWLRKRFKEENGLG